MQPPFSLNELLQVAAHYNAAITPLPVLIYIPTLFIFLLLRRSTRQDTSRGVLLLLAAEWGIVAVLFFMTYVGKLHPVGYFLGGLFLSGGLFYAGAASRAFPPHFFWTRDLQTWLSLGIALGGIFGYPLIGWIFKREFPASISYGLMPGSVTMLTLSVLLSARPAPKLAVMMPAFLWSLTPVLTIWWWGTWEDALLLVAGIVSLVATLKWRHKLEGAPVKDTLRFDF